MERVFQWAAGLLVIWFVLLVSAGIASEVYKDWRKAGGDCANIR